MPIPSISAPPAGTLVLPEVLDLKASAGLAASLIAACGAQLILDGSNVKIVGAQCLQVLVSASKTWRRDGFLFTLACPSEVLEDALRVAGVKMLDAYEEEIAK